MEDAAFLREGGSVAWGRTRRPFARLSVSQACASHVEVGCPSSWGGHSRCHTVAVDPKPQGRRLSARSKAATKRGANAKGSAGAAAKGHSRAAGGPKRRLRRCSWAVQANHSFQLPASCCKVRGGMGSFLVVGRVAGVGALDVLLVLDWDCVG
eukprot:6198039-Pleurochrysis_carterae.AAC.1